MAPEPVAGLTAPPGLARGSFPAMGTRVSVLAPTRRPDAIDAVRQTFGRWDEHLSRFRPDSELSRLNAAAGAPVEVSRLLWQVTSAALDAAAATGGLFDPTLLRPLEALGYDRDFDDLPADRPAAGGAPVMAAGSWRSVSLDGEHQAVCLPAAVGLDFGGIAKGMAVDAALATLAALGIEPAVVEAGGDLAVHGLPDGCAAWPIAVELEAGSRTIGLARGALATSSTARRRWRAGGEERHHLLDPRTGLPAASGVRSATVAALTCRQAEVAAKVALILGPDAGLAFLERHLLTGLLVLDDGTELRAGTWRPA